jgi:hypothetical protein
VCCNYHLHEHETCYQHSRTSSFSYCTSIQIDENEGVFVVLYEQMNRAEYGRNVCVWSRMCLCLTEMHVQRAHVSFTTSVISNN